ncbi:Integrase core domain protein [compost metagenome]
MCHLTSDKARQGKGYVNKNHQSSKLSAEPLDLLDLAEIDNHLIDINIIDRNGNLLGKILWLTIILEIKTRSVIGWELSATYPCAEKTIRALKKALQAVPGEERRRGKPVHLHSDNGSEFSNAVIRYFLDRLNIIFDRGPPYTPNARARIERFFETFEMWLHEQPGTTMSNPVERKYYDSEGEAAFTEADIIQYTEYWIENIYHQRKHKTLNMPPAVAWERAMKNHLPPEKFTEADLNILCRGVTEASISAAGRVHLLCLSWWGPELKELGLSLKKGQQAKCYYNPLNLGEIWVAHPDDTRNPKHAYATCPEYQNGLTLTEHNLLRQQFLAEGREFDDSEADLALYHLRQRMADDYENSRHSRQPAKPKHKTKPQTATQDVESTSILPNEIPQGDDNIPAFKVDRL